MRTLSIRQPWAWLVVNGHMTVINGETTDYRGPALVRAGLSLRHRLHAQVAEHAAQRWGVTIPAYKDLPRGGVVGAVMIDGVAEPSEDHWSAPPTEWPAGLTISKAIPLQLFSCTPVWRERTQFYDVPLHALPERHQWQVRALQDG